MSISPSFDDFKTHFKNQKTQLVWQWVSADLETPVSAYLKLTGEKENSFLLESVEGGENLGRYSAIGFDPDLIWQCDLKQREARETALETLRTHVQSSRIDVVDETIPPMGPSGLFGYMGYGMAGLIEEIPDTNPDHLNIADSIMIRPQMMAVFDNVQSRICLVTPVRDHAGNSDLSAEDVYNAAKIRIESALDALENQEIPPQDKINRGKDDAPVALTPQSNITQDEFHEMVEKGVEYIRAGEIFQVVLGQRFSVNFDRPPFALYRALRRLNPSPFLFFINFEGFSLVGSSPEIMVRVRDRKVTIRPIAGTRPRGENVAQDKALADELLADPKERAEHLMLLDLGRNDVGRVAEIGSVKVREEFQIERYSHVMHIVSNVEGDLRADLDSLDALFAGFPAGTVSGAPKLRAMEIIDELETLRRSFYAGCVGYLDGNGDVDTCIALRTALVKDHTIYIQASGGIVADSDPEAEYQESCNKAHAIIVAAEDALNG